MVLIAVLSAFLSADPFIGSAGLGHTTPAACVPFGMVQAGPDTSRDRDAYRAGWDHCSGYQHGEPWIHRFSQTHLSGTGCVSAGDFGLMPLIGETASNGVFSAGIVAGSEKASPGSYEVCLDNGVRCEIAAAAHSAAYRFTFPKAATASVLVDLDCCAGGEGGRDDGAFMDVFASYVRESALSRRSSTCVTMRRKVRSWIDYEIFAAMEFSRPIAADRLAFPPQVNRGERRLLSFAAPDDGVLEVRLALSMTSEEAALSNLRAEQPQFDLDGVRSRAKTAWEDVFSRVELDDSTDHETRRAFYSALYRLCIQPNDIGDVGTVRYSTFSLWDTFRAAHPLYTLLFPERVDGFVNSLLDQFDRQGYLPIWSLWGSETHCMIGHHAVPIIVDAYLKGFRGFDARRAYAAVVDSLTKSHRAVNDGTWGLLKEDWEALARYGYLPFDGMTGGSRGKPVVGESVSRLLEGSFDDACAERFARAMGDTEREAFFRKRSAYWRNVIDPATGWARGRDRAGRWREPFDPMRCGHCWFQDNDYTEGNAMQYTWHVLQDPLGLQEALGGREKALAKLESIFTADAKAFGEAGALDVSGLIGQYAHGNEPSHHTAYLFTLFGHPERTAALVRQICETQYGTAPDGLCGNDDCGQMSAWYLFSAMGFYPVDPCGGDYVIGAPQVPLARVKVGGKGGRRTFRVLAKGLSKEKKYVKSVTLNGKPITDWKIRHADILAGGELVFEMGSAGDCIDRLCPPKTETAAKFQKGSYPTAVRDYREAAKMAYRYMTSLPAMTVLVETGKPNQKYQHNAYVSKTHAAHIEAMLDWAKLEPAMREKAMRFAKASAEFLLKELEPADAPLAWWPPTYGRKPLEFDPKTDGPYEKPSMIGNEPVGAVKYRGEVMLLYPANVGVAFVDYWRKTRDERFLAAARGIAETFLKTRRADGSWPLKMKLASGEVVGASALVPTRPLELFEKLFDATNDQKWRTAANGCFGWLEAHPLTDWNWDGQFEDIKPEKPYKNPTKHNAIDAMLYMLKRFPGNQARLKMCREILEFCEKRFVVWKAPANHPKWPAPSVLEQYSCFTPIDASAAKMIRGYLAMYRAEGRAEDLAKARALGDAITRVQKPSGRIPTFWEGVYTGDSSLSNERYDWLNCMAAAASALTELAEVERNNSTEMGN